MNYNSQTQRGRKERSFTPVKVTFHKDNTYQQVLTKAKTVWAKKSRGDFFLADGTGSSISCESFTLDLPDGTSEVLPWTMSNYLHVSGIRYPSRARLYCVRFSEEGNFGLVVLYLNVCNCSLTMRNEVIMMSFVFLRTHACR